MIHLDTNFLLGALQAGSSADHQLRTWLADGEPLGISVVSWTEFLCGPVEQREIELAAAILHEPVPLVATDAIMVARLFNLAGRRRGSLADCMIAAIALREKASVATVDRVDFQRFAAAGLRLAGPPVPGAGRTSS